MELQAILEAAKLAVNRAEALNIGKERIFVYTDSRISFHWVTSRDPASWEIYVANRVSQIISLVQKENVKWVGTLDNPADMTSRYIVYCIASLHAKMEAFLVLFSKLIEPQLENRKK